MSHVGIRAISRMLMYPFPSTFLTIPKLLLPIQPHSMILPPPCLIVDIGYNFYLMFLQPILPTYTRQSPPWMRNLDSLKNTRDHCLTVQFCAILQMPGELFCEPQRGVHLQLFIPASFNLLVVEAEICTPCSIYISAWISGAVLTRFALLFRIINLSVFSAVFLFRPGILPSFTLPIRCCFPGCRRHFFDSTHLYMHSLSLCEYLSSDKANTFPRLLRLLRGFGPMLLARYLLFLLYQPVTLILLNLAESTYLIMTTLYYLKTLHKLWDTHSYNTCCSNIFCHAVWLKFDC